MMATTDPHQRFAVSATSRTETATHVETRDFAFTIDEPPAFGGADTAPNPVEYLLGAWAGCLNVVAHHVADEYDLELRSLAITIEGDLDPTRLLEGAGPHRAGYRSIDVTLAVETDADPSTLEAWLTAVEARCPVGDTIQHATPTDLTLERR